MTEGKINQKQADSEVKTFPVPFAFAGNQENITINTFTPSKPSKEQIINEAFKFHSQGNISEAAKYYQYFINLDFRDHRVFSNYGIILRSLGRLQEAKSYQLKAIELKPDFTEAHYNLGTILKDLGKFKEARLSLKKAVDLNPNFVEAHCNLGIILKDLGKLKEAELSFRKAIDLNPDFTEAHYNLGTILKDLGRFKEAELSLRIAISLKPNSAEAHGNLGNILKDLRKTNEAELSLRKAIDLNPDSPQLNSNLGNILRDIGKLKEAEDIYRKAISLDPDYANAHFNLGNILKSLKRLEEASISYQIALEKDPTKSETIAELIEIFSELSLWNEAEKYLNLLSNLDINLQSFNPMKICHLQDEPLLYLKRAKNFFNKKHKRAASKLEFVNKKYIHIGYFSADFVAHPVMYMLARILDLHDNSKFKIFIYSFTLKEDEYTKRIKKQPFNFRSIYGKSDLEAVEIARNDNLDIAIDLMGYTKNNRMNIFSYRVSPIQLCYLCPTTGSKEIDYLIGDRITIPEEYKKYYSENILYMPNSYMCIDNTRKISRKCFTRKELNLPEDAFVLAAFHRNCKITLKEIDSWSKILNNVSNTILWISSTNKTAEGNILKAFEERNVNTEAILFAPKMKSNEEHLSRHSCADIFLDTFSWNANSTAIDSLWVGLPVVTLLGKSFTARTSASLLTTLGLTELIAHSVQEYEDIIISLAKKPSKLRELKNKLLNSKYKNPLFNSKLFTENLEKIYYNLVNNLKSADNAQNINS